MKTLSYDIKTAITKGNTKKAISHLLVLLDDNDPDNDKDILLLNSRYKNLVSQFNDGVLSEKHYNTALNQINEDLLSELEKLPEPMQKMGSCQQFLSVELDIPVSMVQEIYFNLKERYIIRLHQKLDNAITLPLTLTYSQEGTTEDFVETFFDIESRTEKEANKKCIDLVEAHNHLLILGDPGSGKTTLVLEMAIDWLINSSHVELPVLFNLASWDLKDDNLKDWILDTLVHGHGFSKEISLILLNKNLILPIFDGLDEVGKSHKDLNVQREIRKKCLMAMDEYVTESNVQKIVICSRREEYLNTPHNAPIKSQLLVNPLTTELIKSEVESALTDSNLTNKKSVVVKKLMALDAPEHQEFFKVIQTPFYFNILFDMDVFSRTSFTLQNLPTNKEEIESYLLEEFVSNKLNKMEFDPSKSSKYFSWLSQWLVKKDKVNFELADFQLKDLRRPRWINIIGSTAYCFIFFLSGLISELFYPDPFGSVTETIIFGLLISILLAIILGLKVRNVTTHDQQYLIKKKLFKLKTYWSIIFNSIFDFLKNFLFLFIGFICLGVIYTIYTELFASEAMRNSWNEPITRQEDLEGFYIFVILATAILYYQIIKNIVKFAYERREFEAISSPYQRLKSGLNFIHIQLLGLFTLSVFIYFLFFSQIEISKFWIDFADLAFILILLFYFFHSIVQHFIVRLGMYIEGIAPLRLVKFYDQAIQASILEKDGGQWRYRHKILQDYFEQQR